MDEQAIAAQQAKNLPASEPQLNGHPEPEPTSGDLHNNLPLEGSQLTLEISDYFNLGIGARHNGETQSQLNEILTWAKTNAESPDLAGILRTLRHTETILGSNLKQDRMARLYRYVRIQAQKNAIFEKERQLYA